MVLPRNLNDSTTSAVHDGEWGESGGFLVEYLKHEGTSHSSSDLLKVFVKMGTSWSSRPYTAR